MKVICEQRARLRIVTEIISGFKLCPFAPFASLRFNFFNR